MKPIIATSFAGIFVKSEPWARAHSLWFKDAATRLNDNSILEWINRPDYFKGVDQIMQRLHPELSDEQRTIKARELYFDVIVEHIKEHPELKNTDVVQCFQSIKNNFGLALITTNTDDAIKKMLTALQLGNFFDIIEVSNAKEKDDKQAVFERFLKKHGKPALYLGSDSKDTYDFCRQHSIAYIWANFENTRNDDTIVTIHTLDQLKQAIDKIS